MAATAPPNASNHRPALEPTCGALTHTHIERTAATCWRLEINRPPAFLVSQFKERRRVELRALPGHRGKRYPLAVHGSIRQEIVAVVPAEQVRTKGRRRSMAAPECAPAASHAEW